MYWTPWKAGLALGGVFLLAVLLVTPIGVSTQFVVLNGVIARTVNPDLIQGDAESGYTSGNPYIERNASRIMHPVNYGFVFVLAMAGGGFLSRQLRKKRDLDQIPLAHREGYGETPWLRHLFAFTGGVIVLFAARVADGCTSGHMMSGMMQTAVSGYLFAAAAFATAVPTAILLYHPRRAKGGK